jgi:soluble lytic murein transglycosylase
MPDPVATRARRRILTAVAVAAVVIVVPLIVVLARAGAGERIAAHVAGDVDEALLRVPADELPTQAAAFLATDRPWRAARVMRTYANRVRTLEPEYAVLAARAEAEWGAWPETLELLRDVPALDTHEHGIGLYLLGRARDETGDAPGAAEAYRAFLTFSPPAGELEAERAAARLRLGLALIRAGDRGGARQALELSSEYAGGASLWVALLEADALAETGDTAAVRRLVAGHDSGIPGLRSWRARIAAAWAADDVAAARELANQARAWAQTDGTRAEFLVAAARAAIQMGDVAAARSALRSAIDRTVGGPHAREAAELLLAGPMTAVDHLAVARVLRAQGLHQESLDHYRRWIDANIGTAAERSAVHLEHANALFYAERYADVAAALRPIAGQSAARLLRARAEAHRGNAAEAAQIYLGIGGVQALYLAASTWHDENEMERARELYLRVVARHPGSAQMGLSLMRLAGIAYHEGDYREAARLWDQYRTRYPRGTHALEAAYWAGRAREELGDSAGAAALYHGIRERQRDSYYALLASERLGVAYWPLPMSALPGDDPVAARRVAGWMRGIDLLRDAGFPEEASAEADRVVAAAGGDRATRYALAEALVERGYSQRAIRIGLALQGSAPPNRRLLRILYPFPYRTLITEEARDRGFDPYIASALIRQESLFEARITSHAGARGLMQIMPATGRQLAAAAGIEPWDDELLYHPEINVHLGTRYVAQHLDNYDGSLPSVFSAYNAGWHRVERWSEFAEYGDDALFTERIPFRETRDYVRILTRNLALYRGLYGEES